MAPDKKNNQDEAKLLIEIIELKQTKKSFYTICKSKFYNLKQKQSAYKILKQE